MDTILYAARLNNNLEVSVWWIVDDAQYFIEVIDQNNPYDDRMDIYIKEAKGVLSYLSELQNKKTLALLD